MEVKKRWDIENMDMSVRFANDNEPYPLKGNNYEDFYARMDAGDVAQTASISIGEFEERFSQYCEQGLDVVYICLSSGMTSTNDAARMAADSVMEKFPGRKVYPIDSTCASGGFALIVYLAAKKKREGFTAEELVDYVEHTKYNIAQWFTVDNLTFLARSGRISNMSAFLANALKVKPVCSVDIAGHMISVSNAHGRKKALEAMAKAYVTYRDEQSDCPIFISHGLCEKDAHKLGDMIKELTGKAVDMYMEIGPTVATHVGRGCLALFFMCKGRKDSY